MKKTVVLKGLALATFEECESLCNLLAPNLVDTCFQEMLMVEVKVVEIQNVFYVGIVVDVEDEINFEAGAIETLISILIPDLAPEYSFDHSEGSTVLAA